MSIEVADQRKSSRLEKILLSIDRPGDFCTHGRLVVPMPRLEIENVGVLSFPVPASQLGELIREAHQAPYGRGSETLVDTAVRNCWQINEDQVSLGGRSWDETLRKLLHLAADGLGCPREQLRAELYKLLVYQTGGYFIPHRDTEKSDGMVATLTISLPVAGAGGELAVRHKGREVNIEMNVDDPSEMAYAAFYADCEYEVKKVRSGHRVALVFNLILEPDGDEKFLAAPDYRNEADAIAKELRRWCGKQNAANKLVWVLEHEYSEAGLSFGVLKNGDRGVASALAMASEQADCELYAAIVHISEIFDAWYVGGGYNYYDDFGSDDLCDYETGDLIEKEIWMDSWNSPNERDVDFGRLPVSQCELMPAEALEDAFPDDEQVEEAMGNGGATLERAYHYAALVLFRKAGVLDELLRHDVVSGVAWVAEELAHNDGIADDYIIGMVRTLTKRWPEPERYYHPPGLSEMFQLLLRLGEPQVTKEFLCEVASRNYRGDENEELAAVLSTLSAADAKEILAVLINKKFPDYPDGILQLLMLTDRKIDYSAGSRRHLFEECVHEIIRTLPEALSREPGQSELRRETGQAAVIRKKAIKSLFLLFWRADAMDTATSVPAVFDGFPKASSLDREVPKALAELREISEIFHSEAYLSLWRVSAGHLLGRSEMPPEEPGNWKMDVVLACRCPLCEELQEFCDHPEQRVARFPLRKDLRAHLHRQIDAQRLDIDHQTERAGSPYTLVCTKNRAVYTRRMKEYSKDIKFMKSLIESLNGVKSSQAADDEVARLRAAVERGSAGGLN